jgi:required for meiotic nuclear division protein 1
MPDQSQNHPTTDNWRPDQYAGLRGEVLSALPLAIKVGKAGVAVLFRYGAAVLIGFSPENEVDFLETLKPRIGGKLVRFEEETAIVALASETEDQVQAGGPIQLRDMSPERLFVIADVLAKSVVLAHDEREVAKVFEIIEPFAKELADRGRTRRSRKGMLKLLGNALLVQHRVSGRVAVAENQMLCGTVQIWSGSMHGSKMNTNLKSASTHSTGSSP